MFSVDRGQFGPNFVFGAATAAYQIEGGQIDGRGSCIWDTFAATPGQCEATPTTARSPAITTICWPQDLDLIRDGGFDGYRFSLAWPRLIPEGTGAINQAGIDFYDRLIDGMLERGLKPFATLYHWDLPSRAAGQGRLDEPRYRRLVRRLCRTGRARISATGCTRPRRSTSRGASRSSATSSASMRPAIAICVPARAPCTMCSTRTAWRSTRCAPMASRTSAS